MGPAVASPSGTDAVQVTATIVPLGSTAHAWEGVVGTSRTGHGGHDPLADNETDQKLGSGGTALALYCL